jgi:hypothetical protein
MLKDLVDKTLNYHTVMCDSGKLDLLVYNLLKQACNGNKDTIFYVNKKSDVEEMLDLSLIMPYSADQWLFIVNYNKVKRHRRKLIEFIKAKTVSSKVLVSFDKYADFKKFNDDLGALVNSVYLKTLRKDDMAFLFRDTKLGKDLKEFIFYSYRSEVEKVMSVLEYIKDGHSVKTRKDITELVGVSTGSIQHFIFQLLGKPPKTEKSRERIIKNRSYILSELAKVYGVRGIKTILTNSVKDILDIKTLYLSGVVYKSLTNIPDGYDSKRLLRYRVFFGKIIDIEYSRILELYLLLYNEGAWSNELDLYKFLYIYYRNLGLEGS